MNLTNNRIEAVFAQLRAAGGRTLLPFITAGYPDLETTAALLADFERRGVRVCELGIPFSDPVADGPVIQASYTDALADGIKLVDILKMVTGYRAGGGKLALITMVSYSIVFRHGVERYIQDAAQAGIDGLIIPDLPLEEASGVESLAGSRGLANILLIAPTTSQNRRLQIARHSRGFIYYISVAGITGQRDRLPDSTIAAVGELRKLTDTPVCVGFGISNAATVAQVCQVADGAIVGSAIVHRLRQARAARLPRQEMVRQAGEFVSELMKGLPG